ncbi:cytochrome P450 4C1-like [Chrysoperla carnea]|uniref:cytochrome P450 4C1-like n=1 Tax=Chrysoperla carnea TaxID=189513 RepID=UPI001D096FD7|nr:cytochrome P450 4C1-like [Chrysoperla carnea]
MFLILFSIIFILFIVFDTIFRFQNRKLSLLAKQVPGPWGLPFLGMWYTVIDGPKGFLRLTSNLVKKYGNICRAWMGYSLYLVVSKPEDIEAILTNSVEKDYYLKFTSIFAGDGLFIAPAQIWKHRRKLINPTFNTKIVNSFHKKMVAKSNVLCKKLETRTSEDKYFDCYDSLFACTLDILFETNLDFSVDFQNGQLPYYLKYMKRITRLVVLWMGKFWLHTNITFNHSNFGKKLMQETQYMKRISSNIIQEKTLEIRKKLSDANYTGNKIQKPFLEHIIYAKESGFPISETSVVNEVDTMIIAGSDTTAYVMSFALMALGVLQDIQDKVHEEIISVFGNSDRECTLDDIKSMQYLEMVIKETMRLFAPTPLLARKVTTDVQLPNVIVPANTNCIICVLELHRSSDIYPDPLKFEPNRFLPEETAKRHPYAYIPFGGGARGCIGPKFAYLSMKIILTSILRKYKIYSDVNLENIELKMELFLKPVNGFRIRLETR